jgi:hypothetical protein
MSAFYAKQSLKLIAKSEITRQTEEGAGVEVVMQNM